jgi:hypothetical protein
VAEGSLPHFQMIPSLLAKMLKAAIGLNSKYPDLSKDANSFQFIGFDAKLCSLMPYFMKNGRQFK